MKRHLSICIGLLLCYAVCSVSTAISEKVPIREKARNSLPEVASHLKKRDKDDLSDLVKRRYIKVLTSFNKTNFFISAGQLFGFEYNLLKDYEKYLNKGIKK